MPRSEDFNRDEVLDKAKQVFWMKGYNGTSMQDLVDATGLNRSSIYNSFGNKMELYQQSLKKYQDESGCLFNRVKEKNRNAMESVGLAFLYVLDEMVHDKENKGCMLINCFTEMGNQDEALLGLLEANQEKMHGVFEDLVKQGQEDGSIRTDESSDALAHYLVSAFQGFRITGLGVRDPKILKGIIQNILKTIA
ncbi:TetR/AcrR family transcriptional regulator [Aureisphaera galaxeae]|uniref:TetR/AcrR family transcriptional regulator n=1 Tax=Aureisphaera galaxeae TaxID=1538023 RepID=UPI002350122D|nr:TetR/AcrR family transcriptional regulator [Aureisphaera galaxeae]MDC8005327.1 TetR/AcrR family transcriptional regulator [Aureisphaera galaxeae]